VSVSGDEKIRVEVGRRAEDIAELMANQIGAGNDFPIVLDPDIPWNEIDANAVVLLLRAVAKSGWVPVEQWRVIGTATRMMMERYKP